MKYEVKAILGLQRLKIFSSCVSFLRKLLKDVPQHSQGVEPVGRRGIQETRAPTEVKEGPRWRFCIKPIEQTVQNRARGLKTLGKGPPGDRETELIDYLMCCGNVLLGVYTFVRTLKKCNTLLSPAANNYYIVQNMNTDYWYNISVTFGGNGGGSWGLVSRKLIFV